MVMAYTPEENVVVTRFVVKDTDKEKSFSLLDDAILYDTEGDPLSWEDPLVLAVKRGSFVGL